MACLRPAAGIVNLIVPSRSAGLIQPGVTASRTKRARTSSAAGAMRVPGGYERQPAARTARCLIYGLERISLSTRVRVRDKVRADH